MVFNKSSLVVLALWAAPLASAFVYKTTVCPGYKFLSDEAIGSVNRVQSAAECGSEVFRSGTGYGSMEGFAQYDFGNGGDLTTCDLGTLRSSSSTIQASEYHECGSIWPDSDAPPLFSTAGTTCFVCLSNRCYDPECKYFTASGDCLTSCDLPNTVASNRRTCNILLTTPPLMTATAPPPNASAYKRWLSSDK